jgi:hypothetical protein
MSPKSAEQPPEPPPAGRGSIPDAVAAWLGRRSQAIAEATSRPRGKPWAANTYGAGRQLNDAERKARAKAIRDAKAAAERAAEPET